ncbi:hypothetical protein HOS58_gp50 [Streptomyces phage Attoomi]|uniref:Uncharacterized protein n=1 Tax=Streptomyces phage Attoomi TaxID=2059881 RepID=A0A2H5BLJ9_9CAUD|nr:hypothetical protein HOS58_gp50 [Streptomyces phage Attoomi]AUG87182.1 hypothetical protein SEA_ATTOOMI_50 [Streptomyces phage Attoomi]
MQGPYVDEFLEARSKDPDRDPEAAKLLAAIVRRYQEGVTGRDWPTARVLGALMLEVAEEYKDHPDYATRWEAP